jgi:hypothetical protein
MLSMGNFQPQQIAIDALHDLVQQNVVRAPLDQAIFEIQREGFMKIVERLGEGNLNGAVRDLARDIVNRGQIGGGGP